MGEIFGADGRSEEDGTDVAICCNITLLAVRFIRLNNEVAL